MEAAFACVAAAGLRGRVGRLVPFAFLMSVLSFRALLGSGSFDDVSLERAILVEPGGDVAR